MLATAGAQSGLVTGWDLQAPVICILLQVVQIADQVTDAR